MDERAKRVAEPSVQGSSAAVPVRKRGVSTYEVMHELVLYDAEQEAALSLNVSAKAIWELCDGHHTVADISRELAETLGCAVADLQADVEATVEQFRALGLLEVSEAAPDPSNPDDASL